MPANKAREALEFGPLDLLLLAMQRHLVAIENSAERDLDRVEVQNKTATDAVFLGFHGTVRRLVLAVTMDQAQRSVEIVLIATKRNLDALDFAMNQQGLGQTGTDVGNSVLIAALLHVAAFVLRGTNIEEIRNTPYDARLRAYYESMGFENGERFFLSDSARLEKLFTFVETKYQARGLALARRPLPLF